jgi:hypothetical protein
VRDILSNSYYDEGQVEGTHGMTSTLARFEHPGILLEGHLKTFVYAASVVNEEVLRYYIADSCEDPQISQHL